MAIAQRRKSKKKGTSMISIVKGKTEISRNLQKVLNPFFPLPLTGAGRKRPLREWALQSSSSEEWPLSGADSKSCVVPGRFYVNLP
jgi:hypothetical protein